MSDEMIRAFLEDMINGIDSIRDALMLILEQYHVRTEEQRFVTLEKGECKKCQERKE